MINDSFSISTTASGAAVFSGSLSFSTPSSVATVFSDSLAFSGLDVLISGVSSLAVCLDCWLRLSKNKKATMIIAKRRMINTGQSTAEIVEQARPLAAMGFDHVIFNVINDFAGSPIAQLGAETLPALAEL